MNRQKNLRKFASPASFGFIATLIVMLSQTGVWAYTLQQSGSCSSGVGGPPGANGSDAGCVWGGGWCKNNGSNGAPGGNGSPGGNCSVTIVGGTATDSVSINMNVSGGNGGNGGNGGAGDSCGAFHCDGGGGGSGGNGGSGGTLSISSGGKVPVGQIHVAGCPVRGGQGGAGGYGVSTGSAGPAGQMGTVTIDGQNVTSQSCQ